MTEQSPLSPAEAKQRFLLFVAVRLAGLAALGTGLFRAQHGLTIVSGLLIVVGMASLFLRPKLLGLLGRRR